jgi:hypothetical protein
VSVKFLPLTLRKQNRLREFKTKVLRRTFGPKRDEMVRGWRKFVTYWPNMIRVIKSRRMRRAGRVSLIGPK